jgi:activator of 2-hydroxyglutaryl-CoA dehydratase
LAKSARFLNADAMCAFDIGAAETMALTMDQGAKVREMSVNEKDSAGIGSFIRRMARRLGLTQDEMNAVPPMRMDGAQIGNSYIVAGERDLLALRGKGLSSEEIASAVIFTSVIRACAVINDIAMPMYGKVVLVGGVTKNDAFVATLKARQGLEFVIPADAEYAPALGAALAATGWGARR